jgi:hypothetical protein
VGNAGGIDEKPGLLYRTIFEKEVEELQPG